MKKTTEEKKGGDLVKLSDGHYYFAARSSYADDRTLTLNHSGTFGVFNRWGDCVRVGPGLQGIFHKGTRYICELELRLEDRRPLLLSSSIKEDNHILFVDLTNPDLEGSSISGGSIHINRSRFIWSGNVYETIKFHNYTSENLEFDVSLQMEADFKDIFELRGMKRNKHSTARETVCEHGNRVIFSVHGLDQVTRRARISFSPSPKYLDEHHAVYRMNLKGGETKKLEIAVHIHEGGDESLDPGRTEAYSRNIQEIQADYRKTSSIHSDNEQFNHWFNRSRTDLVSLMGRTRHGIYPFAGVPWYNTPFGRDGIITALETLWASPELAAGVLRFLVATQATEENPSQDAEPGKIFHEIREGEMAGTGEIPFGTYYGSIDSTPLFLVLAGEYLKRTGDRSLILEIVPSIQRALEWMERYGDRDGDGYLEYLRRSENGLANQGWKDSHDALSHKNGENVEGPVALCEVQGYAYQARLMGAYIFEHLAESGGIEQLPDSPENLRKRAANLRTDAVRLKMQFNRDFWIESRGTFAFALDGRKNPLEVSTSNAGHLLYSGIADEAKARRLVRTLMGPDLFSGWGIRTLSSREVRYNPMSYHNGSIWPHDTAIVAGGMARYGFKEDALELLRSMFDATLFLELQRLPELFCGFERREGEGPTAYPVACSPQAWSVAAIFLFIEAALGMEVDAVRKQLIFRSPRLPDFMDRLDIHDLTLGNSRHHLEFRRYTGDTGVHLRSKPDGWDVIIYR